MARLGGGARGHRRDLSRRVRHRRGGRIGDPDIRGAHPGGWRRGRTAGGSRGGRGPQPRLCGPPGRGDRWGTAALPVPDRGGMTGPSRPADRSQGAAVSRLDVSSPAGDVDPRVANRRTGGRTKGPPAHEVLAEALGVVTVGDLLRHYPRRYIDRSATVPIREARIGQDVTVIGT